MVSKTDQTGPILVDQVDRPGQLFSQTKYDRNRAKSTLVDQA